MISFFPEIYPDELLYSQLARYHSRSGYARYIFSVSDLFKNDTTVHPSIEFVNQYTSDAMNWITKNKPWEYIIEHHTMYPAYIRFLPKQRRNDAVNGLIIQEGNYKNLMCIPVLGYKRYLKYCPECAKEDREKYGETYWHREHQIQRIRVCPKHRCYLENSIVEISGKSSPGLHDAETFVPIDTITQNCEIDREISFTKYVIDVMREPVDLENPLPIGQFLHSRLSKQYSNDTGLVRNISKLYNDYCSFFDKGLPLMKQSYMQKIFNGYQFAPFFVLQLAYFEKISVEEITHLPVDVPLYDIERIYKNLSDKYDLDFSVVQEIGNEVLKHSYNQSRVSRKSGKRSIKYEELDNKYLPQVKKIVKEILSNNDRPQKVSISKVQKNLGLAQKQFDKMPKCKEYIIKHIETQPEYWAREVVWAINVLIQNDKPVNFNQISKLTNMRKRDIECCIPFIKDFEIKQMLEKIIL